MIIETYDGKLLPKEKRLRAELIAATKLGFIQNESIAALLTRMEEKNKENREKVEKKEVIYGLVNYSLPMYIQYERTLFLLDFVENKAQNYQYVFITENMIKEFYKKNKLMFRRCNGDELDYKEIKPVIEKRLREEEYERYVQNVLCKLI
ncbi:MAG: hypothetical protein IKL51_11655 [Lachnospiraceae bacterium]|nr:hypothetical protein [Lachnospiraceae bacterium]